MKSKKYYLFNSLQVAVPYKVRREKERHFTNILIPNIFPLLAKER
jgi:hypothetical protein